jgi:hypothetical protein
MSATQSLALAAAMIRANTPNLRLLVQLLEDGGQKRMAAMLTKLGGPAKPVMGIDPGRPHPRCGDVAGRTNQMTRFPVTIFPDRFALTKRQIEVSVPELASLIESTRAPTKAGLPLLKLATFGNERTDKNCLRCDKNVTRVFGVEIDYDGERVPFDEAVRRLREARVAAILYTSASHRPDAPRWRALLPFAEAKEPTERRGWALRAGKLLGVELGSDSLTLSLTYHFGRLAGGEHFRIEIIPGEPIDVGHTPIVEEARIGPMIEEARIIKTDLVGERRETTELTAYGRAALVSASRNIINAPNGQQEQTLNREGYTIGQAAAAGVVPSALALEVLVLAANEVRSLDPRRPWRPGEAERKVRRAFHQGWGKPRPSIEQLEAEWRPAQDEAPHDFVVPTDAI